MAESSGLLSLSKDICLSIKTAVEPYASRVINTMTSDTLASPPNPPSAAAKTSPSQTRRLACTHLTMRRYYGASRCPICRRDPDLGYTYLCTQDELEELAGEMKERFSEASEVPEGTQDQSKQDEVAVDGIKPVTNLSPWIAKAIEMGGYTPEQVRILRAQKQKVVDTINAAMDQSKEYSSIDTTKLPRKSSSTGVDTHLPFPFVYDINSSSVPSPKPEEKNVPRLFPYCEFRACQTCRPTFRDRAWLRLEDVFADPSTPTIDFANDNRPLSNPFIVAGIGTHEPSARPNLRKFDSFSLYRPERPLKRAAHEACRYRSSTAQSTDITSQRPEHESLGFRESVKRAFRGMLLARGDTTSSSRFSRRMSRRMRVREVESSEDRMGFDMGLWKELNDELLHMASNVRLPGHDGMDGLDKQREEVEVGDGVAVMEESVDMGTADVIMSL